MESTQERGRKRGDVGGGILDERTRQWDLISHSVVDTKFGVSTWATSVSGSTVGRDAIGMQD